MLQVASEPAKKATTVVRVGKPTNFMEVEADNSSDKYAMVVQVVNQNTPLLNSTIIIDVLSQDGARYGSTISIDNDYMEYMIMPHMFAISLGYDQEVQGRSYNTTKGLMTTTLQVSSKDICLPYYFSWSWTFLATIQVAPEQFGDFGYGNDLGMPIDGSFGC